MGAPIRSIGERGARRLASAYFAVSHRLLATPAGREFLRASAAAGAPAVHGYSTSEDLEALLEALRPSTSDLLVDLGCGIGDVAIAIHQRTGCRVVGVDVATRAVVEARQRAREACITAEAVRFEVGDLASLPVGAAGAYALDSMMFAPRPPKVLASASRSLEPPGRIFATFIDHRGLDREGFVRFIERGGLRLERLDDVTAAFREGSRRRAAVARRLLRGRPPMAGRFGLLMVLAEESIMTRLIDRGRSRRWRFTVFRAPPGLDEGADPPTSAA